MSSRIAAVTTPSARRALGYTALAAAGYFGGLGVLMEQLRSHGIDVAASGLLLLGAIAVVLLGPATFGFWITGRTEVQSYKPVGLGALAGASAAFVVPTVISALADPEGGIGVAIITAVFSLVGAWCVAVATGLGSYWFLRQRDKRASDPQPR